MKKVSESERFVIGWGKKGDGLCFFVNHKDISKKARPTNPEHLVQVLTEAIEYIESNKKQQQFLQNWMAKK